MEKLLFWSKVEMTDGCWLWTGKLGYDFYGLTSTKLAPKGWAHRASYILSKGPIPKGMEVCHTCDNHSCVRPDHLFLASKTDNFRDMFNKNRHAKGSRHGMAKLTEKDIPTIRARLAAGELPRVIAADYGVHRIAINQIRLGRTWASVT